MSRPANDRARSANGGQVPNAPMVTLLAAALAVAVAVAVAGCSSTSGSGSAAPKATQRPDALAAYQRYVNCARSHGLPQLPDPRLNPDGSVELGGSAAQQIKNPPDAVRTACAQLLAALPAQPNTGKTVHIDALLAFARCVRGHGVPDWPDPDADGSFQPPPRLILQGDAAIERLTQPCRHYLTQP